MSAATKANNYIEAIGRRKTATARVRLTPAAKLHVTINDKPFETYFGVEENRKLLLDVFTKAKIEPKFTITAVVSGSGIHSQAEAIRLGIARALVKQDETVKSDMRKLDFLKRDPRAKERRKAGLAGKARKGKQWSKR